MRTFGFCLLIKAMVFPPIWNLLYSQYHTNISGEEPSLKGATLFQNQVWWGVVEGCWTSSPLHPHSRREKNEATTPEVENWLKMWKRVQERRALLTDQNISRGWEASDVMAVGSSGLENLVMRTCCFCYLTKIENIQYSSIILAPSGALIAIPTYYWPSSTTNFFRSHRS